MQKSHLDEALDRARKLNAFLSEVDEALRPLFFESLKVHLISHRDGQIAPLDTKQTPAAGSGATQDWESFLQKHQEQTNQPAQAAFFCAAWWFSQYGSAPFSSEDIKDIAQEAGLTLPGRLDMTFKSAKSNGKDCFQSAGRGKLKPTTIGELRLKEDWQVTKGNKAVEPKIE